MSSAIPWLLAALLVAPDAAVRMGPDRLGRPPEPPPVAFHLERAPSDASGSKVSTAGEWRSLVTAIFRPDDVEWALRVIQCESGGDPTAVNPRTGAAGLMQAMPQWYTGAGYSEPSPYGPFDPFDPEANLRFGAWLLDYEWGGRAAWVCK